MNYNYIESPNLHWLLVWTGLR